MIRYSSTRSYSMRELRRSALPWSRMSPPGCCFSRAISSSTLPLMMVEFCHTAVFRFFETTYFGMPFIRSAKLAVTRGGWPECSEDLVSDSPNRSAPAVPNLLDLETLLSFVGVLQRPGVLPSRVRVVSRRLHHPIERHEFGRDQPSHRGAPEQGGLARLFESMRAQPRPSTSTSNTGPPLDPVLASCQAVGRPARVGESLGTSRLYRSGRRLGGPVGPGGDADAVACPIGECPVLYRLSQTTRPPAASAAASRPLTCSCATDTSTSIV